MDPEAGATMVKESPDIEIYHENSVKISSFHGIHKSADGPIVAGE
jgi:hypothetical protein